MLPTISGEFGIVKDPEIRFSENGGSWATVRCVFKDRKRDAQGQWVDGDPNFINVTISSGAEHFVDSVSKGDSIVLTGRLVIREYEQDGVKRQSPEIRADSIGPSTRWNVAKTPRTLESGGPSLEPEQTAAPF